MKLEGPLIGILIASLFFVGLFGVFTDIADTQSTSIDQDFSPYSSQNDTVTLDQAFDRIDETKEQTDSITEDFQDTILNQRTGTDLFAFFNVFYKVGKQIFNSVNVVKDILNIIVEMFGIPAEIVGTFFSILLIMLVLLILYLLLGRST